MEMLKVGKIALLAFALAVAAGCSSKGGDASGEGAVDGSTMGVDPNAGYGQGSGAGRGNGFDSGMGNGSGYGNGGDDAALRAMNTFYFDFDSSDLKPEAMQALDVHARDLRSNGMRVVLEGHTDERGTREYNMALGERRAQSVQRYLVMQGVSASQLELVSYGEERPAVLGHDEAAWAKNRRVELHK